MKATLRRKNKTKNSALTAETAFFNGREVLYILLRKLTKSAKFLVPLHAIRNKAHICLHLTD